MKEREFASKIASELKTRGFYMKIPDSYGMKRFTSVKNFDAFFVMDSKIWAIEYKVEKGISLAIDKIRDSQVEALSSIAKHGGTALIVVYIERKKHALVLTIQEFKELCDQAKQVGRKSIPIITPNVACSIMTKCTTKGRPWDVEKIIGARKCKRT